MNYERYGQGEPLLLLHGMGGELCVWEPVLDFLAARADVIAVDLPGFGRSPALPASVAPTPRVIADRVARLLDELGIINAHIAGNSLGGWIALELGKTFRACSVTAVCPAGLWSAPVLRERDSARGGRQRVARRLRPLLPLLMLSRRARRLALGPVVADPDRVPPVAARRMVRSYARAPAYEGTSPSSWRSSCSRPPGSTTKGGDWHAGLGDAATGRGDLMRQPIGSRLHGALDYLTGVSLLAASRIPALRGRFVGAALQAAGGSHLAYSLVTDYELGVLRKLPYKVHLLLDAAGACGLAAAGATRSDAVDRFVPVGIGLYELGAVLLSDPQGGAGGRPRRAVSVNRPEADVRAFLADPGNVRAFSPDGTWTGEFELRAAPGGRGTEIHADADPDDLRRAKQLLEAGEIVTTEGSPAGRRGPLSAVLPTLDTGQGAT